MRHLPEPPRSAELVVIGSGIVGAATAFFAARAGFEVVVVERRRAPCTFTTAVAAGGYRLQLEHREELELVARSVRLFEHFAEETGQQVFSPGVRRNGYLWLTSRADVAERQRELVRLQADWGVDGIELLDGDAVRARFPWVAPEVLQARFRQADGLIAPRSIALGLLEGSGADLVLECDVEGFEMTAGRLTAVRTSLGPIAAGVAVIAAGPLSGVVAELAGVQLPVETVRRQRLVLWDVPQVPPDAPMTIDEDTTAHWRPVGAGAYALFPDPAEPAAAPADVVDVDPDLALRLLDPNSPIALARTAPFWSDVWHHGSPVWAVQAGQYTMTPDQRPLIGVTGVEGLYVNTGYSGHGVMAGPAGGEHLAGVLAGRRSDNQFRLDRTFRPASQVF